MGRSRRKYKKSRPKVRVALPKKNPRVVKAAFNLPPKLRSLIRDSVGGGVEWDDMGSVLRNYKSFGVVSNPNLLGVRSRNAHTVESGALQVPPPPPQPSDEAAGAAECDMIDSGSDLEEDDLKSALGKKRRDGKSAPSQPLTAMQRVHVGRLIEKHGDDYQAMFRDMKLNAMQHSVATLEKLCKRYCMYTDKNPLILSR
ncbi:nucleolar protein 16 [Syzygium oleosum]|uniref:nucleolar protein 16 n=1 Tax=Syzygium oleosum TaxID=219896 RepID=UPI0011D22054|nr:nucleolar protein 16 [Syzygium oleosum]XP_056176572.1 nucleolar protein 16 [Syzygium oleosum]